MTEHQLKCRFCDWHTPRWITTGRGTHRHGHQRLDQHVEQFHDAEYEAIMARVLHEEKSAPDMLDEC